MDRILKHNQRTMQDVIVGIVIVTIVATLAVVIMDMESVIACGITAKHNNLTIRTTDKWTIPMSNLVSRAVQVCWYLSN